MRSAWIPFTLWLAGAAWVFARPIEPAHGLPIPDPEKTALSVGVVRLGDELSRLGIELPPEGRALLPDVQVLHKAVAWALVHEEFQSTNEPAVARRLLDLGFARAAELRAGRPGWPMATGLVVRGFVSRVDGSIQPYGVVVPPGWIRGGRLDVWLHGRDDRLTELRFLGERLRSPGEFAPADALVVHPYGRYCNAFKFAGETDVLEAMTHAVKAYGADVHRLAIRGFSMGGAGAWHLAVHHPGLWRAAAPGAGFAETAGYTHILEKEPGLPEWERRLWHWYDATDYAANLRQLPLLAYSGELDPQRQAARMMDQALVAEGMTLDQVIGPGVEHRYEPGAKRELARRFDGWMATPAPELESLDLTTFTLRYPAGEGRVWARFEGLGRHWERARLRARRLAPGQFDVTTENVTAFSLRPDLPASGWMGVTVDGAQVSREAGPGPLWFERQNGRWRLASATPATGKRPGLQGPIDDAFMDPFLVVVPTGRSRLPAVDAWVQGGWRKFTNDWRAQFRGDVRIKRDVEVTPDDLAAYNMIVWGDPDSNRLLQRMQGHLPVDWGRRTLAVGQAKFAVAEHVPSFIAPNPLNPAHYVVVNSGHTFASWEGTNARQTPRLPDWAVWKLREGAPPVVEQAGFFSEKWGP